MFGKVKLFKTYSKKNSKKVDVCYRDYPDEENFASETIIELDYKDTLIIITMSSFGEKFFCEK